MPINKIVATKRGKAAVAATVAFAIASGWYGMTEKAETPQTVRAAIAKGITPAPVKLAIDKLIKPWEGVHTTAYKDIVGVWTICWGETKGVRPGMKKTLAECDAMLTSRVINDYYLPLVDKAKNFTVAPISVQASMISGAYNFGTAGQLKSTQVRVHIAKKNWRAACEAQTAYNKAAGRTVKGLVNRREMGDAQRIGEAELCVSGL